MISILNIIGKVVRHVIKDVRTMSQLAAVVLDAESQQTTETEIKENPVLEPYLETPLASAGDTSVKKAMAVAMAIAKKKGIETIEVNTPFEAAAAIDEGFSRFKVAYQLGKGLISSTKAAEEMIDRGVARLVAFSDKVIEAGVPVVIEKILPVVTAVYPPIAKVIPVIKTCTPFITKAAKAVVRKGLTVAGWIAKKTVSTVVNDLKSVVKHPVLKAILG